MRYGSVCSGVEAASLAWEPLGWTPAFFAEVDPFCRKLLAHRWPHVPNLGDITADDFTTRAAACGPIDLLVGGTPCQSFSHAGKRGGFDDPRGDLTLRYLDLVGEIRPAWLVWENVPGVLSQDGGRAFGTVLGKMADLGYRLAYRVLDAALAGVPQRRRRVFVVGHLGAVCPGQVLALAEGQGRDSEAGGEAGAEAAAAAGGGPAAVTVLGTVTHALTSEAYDAGEDGTGRGTPLVAYQCHGTNAGLTGGVPFVAQGYTIKSVSGDGEDYHAVPTDRSRCLDQHGGLSASQGGLVVVNAVETPPQGVRYVVRRLTPRECERLQGMPDDHTLIPVKPAGKTRRKDREYREIDGEVWEMAADGPRYRAIGNSMAVCVMRQIGERIDTVVKEG